MLWICFLERKVLRTAVLLHRLQSTPIGRLSRVKELHRRDIIHALERLLFLAGLGVGHVMRHEILMNSEHVADGLAFKVDFLGVLVRYRVDPQRLHLVYFSDGYLARFIQISLEIVCVRLANIIIVLADLGRVTLAVKELVLGLFINFLAF